MIWENICDLGAYLYDRQSIIFIESIFAVIYLVVRKFAIYLWDHDKGRLLYIRVWFHYYEYIFFFVAAVLAPKHTVNESMMTIVVVVIIKIIFDKTRLVERYLEKRFCN